MRHSIFLVALVLLSATSISAQEKAPSPWTKAGFVGLKFTQSSFTNWAAGGENALALDAQFTYQADYKNEKHLWQNRVELNYGFNQTGDAPLKKTTDKIYLNSNYGFQIEKSLYLSAFLTYQSQFSNGYQYGSDNERTFVSRFMAPGYVSAYRVGGIHPGHLERDFRPR